MKSNGYFEDDDYRVSANLEMHYEHYLANKKKLNDIPDWMAWKKRNGTDYLYISKPTGSETSLGKRSEETELIYENFQKEKNAIKNAGKRLFEVLERSASLYVAAGLPVLDSFSGRILRALDDRGLLGSRFIVVGTNAFVAYVIESGFDFMKGQGIDQTEDFDLSWSQNQQKNVRIQSKDDIGLLSLLKGIDQSFTLNQFALYQAYNADNYEVELLSAPSVSRFIDKKEVFRPTPLKEQEWLLMGNPVRHIVASRNKLPVPIVAPDPRYMALHKVWLSKKQTRDPLKSKKDLKQGLLLWETIMQNMARYPIDAEFIQQLPDDIRGIGQEMYETHLANKNDEVGHPEW